MRFAQVNGHLVTGLFTGAMFTEVYKQSVLDQISRLELCYLHLRRFFRGILQLGAHGDSCW